MEPRGAARVCVGRKPGLDANMATVQTMAYPSPGDAVAIGPISLYTDPGETARRTTLMEREGMMRDSAISVRRSAGIVSRAGALIGGAQRDN